jgi:hypothetical protein
MKYLLETQKMKIHLTYNNLHTWPFVPPIYLHDFGMIVDQIVLI